ncbi:hypothetical protein K2173_023189 [Erythroxylum novogranatense]|uniref:Uncharacterized protein n=1 Tax=Erythroxylum novogranatense TaxID=1862640 RepID=A0AAV8UBE7_9ROSI|nr:hypothetical protein K2173_023189 [Erythroxylum novogranatense]
MLLLVNPITTGLTQHYETRPISSDVRSQMPIDPKVIRKVGSDGKKSSTVVKRAVSEVLGNVKLSASPYDTAWVAMVPSPEEKTKQSEPLFPESLDWVTKHQRPDGSWCLDDAHPLLVKDALSSTLACVLALNKWSVGEQLVNKVPTAYPLDIYIQLCTIDNLQKLAIDRFFHEEIQNAMDHIYRCWLQGSEEIFSDINCLAMGFRLLRMNGYDVSSDALEQFQEGKRFFTTVSLQFENTDTVLELYKASLTKIYQNEQIIDRIREWTRSYLEQELRNRSFQDKRMQEEVKHALKFRYDSLIRLEGRRNLEWLQLDNTKLLKTSYRTPIDNKLFLELSLRDFNLCQSIYREELKQLERWLEESRLGELKFARQKLTYCYVSAAVILIAPEDSEARISMTKNAVITTVVDDFFDFAGSKEELENMIELFGRWQGDFSIGYCSKNVEILFSAIETVINELGSLASRRQGRDVTHHMIKIWHDLLSSELKEAEWARKNCVPTLEEYIETSAVSVALGPVMLVSMFFIGPVLSEEVLASVEYDNLFRHVNLVGRLLNDLGSDEREEEEGKLSSVVLRMLHKSMTKEEAVSETWRLIESYRVELLRMVLETKDSEVPKACKDYIWKMSHLLHSFYNDKDGYTCNIYKLKAEKFVLWEPVTVPRILSFERK